ncbi:aminoglycoside phosphotransferase family protein [Arthrobacter sp. ATA002]|uniref:aminoglycoside phosphotransferase family protein n=1 Tax=Arthrobacter sp. ATA002 TaxID=2991715 RepID=UPI0022A7F432|nr:aminoglycoside phosphotransferase family protein [Arthrobacter sp. ATA002]WAP52623.1 aminoglycoside phosphotransferase family protein [Arthrobacter sp. ATA002]
MGATTARLPGAGSGTVKSEVGGIPVRLWVHPRDPVLTGLPWATDPGAVARGVFGAGSADARAALTLVAYRPLRRAVVRATYQGESAYLKVPQPRLAAGLRRRLQLAGGAGLPVPPLLETVSAAGPAADGVLVLGSLPGQSLHRGLLQAGTDWDPGALTALLDRLPPAALALPRKAAWSERILDYGAGAAVALPAGAERILHCAQGVAGMVRSTDPGPLVPAHGDFHGGNLLAGNSPELRLTGLLDVDALGPGHRVDDLACFLGHLSVLAAQAPGNGALQAAAIRCARVFTRSTGAAALYCRAAGVALTLVAGTSGRGPDAALRTLSVAEELLAAARGRS